MKIMNKRSMKSIGQLVLIVLFVCLALPARAQDDKLQQAVPVDSTIRIGKLDNGMTYYIRRNEKPEKRVEMRLAVKAGSVLEDDDQRGVAHFVEHMAFNGTKNFARNELVHYMQSVGVQFGPEVNAQTGFNETIYMLTLPTDSIKVLENGFRIMEDWAHNITFDDQEIDKERGIIVEEWRLKQGLTQRLMDLMYPALFEGSKYANRIPIGTKESVENVPHDKIRKFYTDWYRPDLMAFIIVGDVDPDAMEKSIREHFGNLKNPQHERPRNSFAVPSQPATKPLVIVDKEVPVVEMAMFCKKDPEKVKLQKDWRKSLMYQLISSMYSQRLNELKEQANPPLLGGQVSYGNLVPELDYYQVAAAAPETGIDRGIQTLFTEYERIDRFGFTQGELDRQKKEFMTLYENAYNERFKTNSASYASEYLRNFLSDEPIPGIEFEYNFMKEYLGGITVEEVNDLVRQSLTGDNRLFVLLAPEKEGLKLPDNDQILNTIQLATKSDIQPYQDKVTDDQLMSSEPAKGRILLSKKNEALGTVEMKLSNGARVVLKPTDFKNDQVLFSAYSPGGYSLCNDTDHYSAYFAAYFVNQCGVAEYTPSDISKILAGKNVSVSPYLDDYFEGVSGSSTPRDLESMFQLNYLYFTQPRKDTAIFKSLLSLEKEYVKNATSNPETYFFDQVIRTVAQNNPRADVLPTEQDVDRIDMKRLFEIYQERFADASDFTFFLVGSFKTDSIKPLIEKYLASLPSLKRQETWKDMGIRPPVKKIDKSVYKGKDPKSLVALYFDTNDTWDPEKGHDFESLGQLLQIRYLDVLREAMSGTYTISVSCNMTRVPYTHAALKVIIPCSPDNTDKLTKAAVEEIRSIQKNE
jgi:zinc protease